MEQGQESSGGDSRKMVGSHHPLARPHAVPGVRDNTGGSEMPAEILHRRAVTTRVRLAWSGAAGQVEQCVLLSEAGCGILRLWQSIYQLLHGSEVFRASSPEIFEVQTRKLTRILFRTEALIIGHKQRISPGHLERISRLRSEGSVWAFYSAHLVKLRLSLGDRRGRGAVSEF